ncbi:anti-sigma factor [Aurantibacter crassamenti]|uniref:anti-sigma factor n=1 Tax=Aurantibacter crassamenti TaxID=1837375 RepID=UPI001939E2AF|nr:anti-sigma factor [Aurantibacter crassamenti]MBM1107638.1 anti-sigma factor [Aurantibacter crassamenti]
MDVKKYIDSGILELYVAGQLSDNENLEVHKHALENTEVLAEIVSIENAILELSKTASPKRTYSFDSIKERILKSADVKVIDIAKKESNWSQYVGWAASVLFAAGLFYMYTQNENLKSELEVVVQENLQLEQQISDANLSLEKSNELLATIRDKNISVVPLGGQEVSPTSYAKAYWNTDQQKLFIDAQGLPEPPDGFVYQVWSLKLNPLTPTSVGLLEDFVDDENKVFALNNPNDNGSEAFGITLEPAGGSESPNLEQLYALGVVAAS